MIRTYDVEQRSEAWDALRCGMVTASMVGRLISVGPPDALAVDCPECSAVGGEPCLSIAAKANPKPIKGPHRGRLSAAAEMPPVYSPATGDTAKELAAALVAERINGWAEPVFVNQDMMRGVLDEPLARALYARTWAPVDEVGFVVRDDWGFSIGCSPDGLVGTDGGIEIKSRRAKNHLLTVLDDTVPAKNMAQIQCTLLVTGRKWWDYVSYSGGMPMWRTRVYPDPDWQGAIVGAVRMFEATATEMVATYTERTAGLPATERTNYDQDVELKL